MAMQKEEVIFCPDFEGGKFETRYVPTLLLAAFLILLKI
jgi:hypothetical protein